MLLLAGCGSTGGRPEKTREVVLQYLGGDFGTVGPFGRERKKELDVLAPADRTAALALLDQGALGYTIYQSNAPTAQRMILVAKDKVVGDYRIPPEAAAAADAKK